MRRATLEELARDPAGRYTAGETFVHFCAHPRLWGVVLWGRPAKEHARDLGASLVLELRRPAVPHASIFDASRLESGSAGAFDELDRYVASHAEALRRWVTRLAIVRPDGLTGAVVAGARDVLHLPYPVSVFDHTLAALAWLGESSPDALAAELRDTYAEASRTPAELGALRALLDANLRGVSLASSAKKLGVSERTLQRRLGEAGTTFQSEATLARVRASKRLLVESDAALTAIAVDAGWASLQHFNAMFRKRTGLLPSAWRRRARSGSRPGRGSP